MNITTTSKLKTHNNTQKTKLLLVVLLTVVLISSLLIVGAIMINSNDPSPDGGVIHVKNEKELTNIINKVKNPIIITLDNDITLTKTLTIPNKRNITLTSNTTNTEGFFKLVGTKDQTTINVNHGGVLHLAGITVTHKSETTGLGVNVTNGGKLYMTTGEISGNRGFWSSSYGYGGGVAVYEGGFFEMTGGVICDNDGARYGGGVAVRGFFNMSDNAIIANNSAKEGWGVFVTGSGTFYMAGNSMITNNNSGYWADCNGCGVYNAGYFEMSGNSVITNNYASGGGGVYNAGYFEMSGNSVITNNTAVSGGGVFNRGYFEMSDNALISGNVADHGGGVCIEYGGSFVMMTGNIVIASNIANTVGGGVYIGEEVNGEGCDFEMQGGKISDNFAQNDYGGVYNKGTFNQTGGTITGNKTNGKHPNQ